MTSPSRSKEASFWWETQLFAEDHFAPGPDSPDEAHEDFYQRQQDEGNREQVALLHGEGSTEAERRLAWLMETFQQCKGWKESV